ncbi:MAG: hypothetical protein HS129_15110 [Leptospiraceae bacterium]|nr:hypothetical protein [Leptospiraceae bacterium]
MKSSFREVLSESWDVGQSFQEESDAEKLPANKDVLKFFQTAYKFDIGNTFSNHKDAFTQAVEEALNTGNTQGAINRLKEELLGSGLNLDGELIQKMDFIVRGQILRTRNFSRVYRLKEIGIEHLEIIAILDQKTSLTCRIMNGRIVEIETAVNFIEDFTSEYPADPKFWTDKFKNPLLNFDKHDSLPTKDLVGKNGVLKNQLPPYHPRCRTIVVASFETKIEKAGGGFFSGTLDTSNADLTDPKWKTSQRYSELQNLTPQELLNRIDALRNTTVWDTATIDRKFGKHGAEFGANDSSEYVKMSEDILQSFDRVFAYYRYNDKRFGFYSKKYNGLVTVDPDSNKISTFFQLDPQKTKVEEWLEIL